LLVVLEAVLELVFYRCFARLFLTLFCHTLITNHEKQDRTFNVVWKIKDSLPGAYRNAERMLLVLVSSHEQGIISPLVVR
jgi:hypothetical protein